MSSSTGKLPPIAHLLNQAGDEGNYDRRTFNSTPGPRSQHSFPEAQSLAPTPLAAGRGRQSFSTPHNQYTSESTVSSEFPSRRSARASWGSTTVLTRESPSLPPIHVYHGSHLGVPLEPHHDPRLPPVYSNGESAYPHSAGTVSPPRPGMYGPSYDSRTPQQDYMTSYSRAPSYGVQNGSQSFSMNIEQVGGEFSDGKQKRRRGNLPKQVTDILRNWFQDHVAHPYPTEDEKQQLMHQTGLSLSQISNWFINARRRSLPQIHKQAQTESDLREGQMQLHNN